jgi:ABC-type multidrug transport system ATPase subunit
VLFPEVGRLDEELLPEGIPYSYPLLASLVHVEELLGGDAKIVLLVEEPELGLDLRRQRLLAEHMIALARRTGGRLATVVSTHSIEMLVSLTKGVARRMRGHATVYEVLDGMVKCRQIGRTGEST